MKSYGSVTFSSLVIILSMIPLSTQQRPVTNYLQFSSQSEKVLFEPTNFATLQSGTSGVLPSRKFTICSSVYVKFFRDKQIFYTIDSGGKFWFSVFLENQDLSSQSYNSQFFHQDGGIFSRSPALRLRPHHWSHACTTVDAESGHVIVVINGVVTHNVTITSVNFLKNSTVTFENNLKLGLVGLPVGYYQSEASVANVNIHSVALSLPELIDATSTGDCTAGDHLSWKGAIWKYEGEVQSLQTRDLCMSQTFPHVFFFGKLLNWRDCKNLCSKLQEGGRIPSVGNVSEFESLLKWFQTLKTDLHIFSPFVYESEGNFVDFYQRTPIPSDLPWWPGEPNGGVNEKCASWLQDNIFDDSCDKPYNCLCKFYHSPILRLRGLCKNSNVDTHYIVKNIGQQIEFLGLTGTEIKFFGQHWVLSVNTVNTTAMTFANEESFILGLNSWIFTNESAKCREGSPHLRELKLTRCHEGEFTCSSGDCVSMEERCDQAPNCKDKSDEVDCRLLQLEKNYNKKVPPFTSSQDNTIVPVQLDVFIDLLKVVEMEETNHKIDFQFSITLEWRENERVLYHNLKRLASLNALSDKDIDQLWLPLVIYDNTDQKEMTRLGEYGNGEWNTRVSVVREGNITRSSLDVLDKIEIFAGGENRLSMEQVYTWEFQCFYNLQYYPFDTQVGLVGSNNGMSCAP